jgi:hypothetical protein
MSKMETMERKKPRPLRSFTPEFKAEIVELCRRGERSIGQVAKDFDCGETKRPVFIVAGSTPGVSCLGSPECVVTRARGAIASAMLAPVVPALAANVEASDQACIRQPPALSFGREYLPTS